jgi:hypothetical protein
MNSSNVSEEQIADIRAGVIEHTSLAGVAELRVSAGRRRIRNRVGGTIAAVLAVAVLGTSGAYALGELKNPAGPVAVHGPLTTTEVSLTGARIRQMEPVDPDNAYALIQLKSAKYGLARTTDGGATWTTRQLPAQPKNDSISLDLLGPLTALVGRLITRDGGETWAAAGKDGTFPAGDPGSPAIGKKINAAPRDWFVTVNAGIDPKLTNSPDVTIGALDPATGTFHAFVAQPKAKVADLPGVNRSGTGAVWGVSLQGNDLFGLHISPDGGASWSDTRIAASMAQWNDFATDGRVVYHTVGMRESASSSSDHAPIKNMRVSTDGGKSWAAAFVPDGVTKLGKLQVLPDGSLVGSGSTGAAWAIVRSTDGGKTFGRIADLPGGAYGTISRTLAGSYVCAVASGSVTAPPGHYLVSADGKSWKQIPPPIG